MTELAEWWFLTSVALAVVLLVVLGLLWRDQRRERQRPRDPEFEGWVVSLDSASDRHPVVDYQPFVAALCAAAVRLDRQYTHCLNSDPDPSRESQLYRHTLLGELFGLRRALCLLHGWDTDRDLEREGRADDLIWNWYARQRQAAADPTLEVTTE